MRWSVWVAEYNLDKVSHHLSERLIQSASNHTMGSEIILEHFKASVENAIHIWGAIWLVGDRLYINVTKLLWTGRNYWLGVLITYFHNTLFFAANNHNPWYQGNCIFISTSSFLPAWTWTIIRGLDEVRYLGEYI